MRLDIRLTRGSEKVIRALDRLSGPQLREALAKGLNDGGFALREDMQREMYERFDRPTDFIIKAPKVFRATPDNLQVTVAPTYRRDVATKGGKIGVDPQQVLQAQEFGGKRRDKRSEAALRRAGILPAGYQLAIPAAPFPGSEDGHGNLLGAFLKHLISYFQAFREQGYKANMTKRSRDNLLIYGRTKRPRKMVGPQIGRRYIVAYGKLRGGARRTSRGDFDERASNLAPGIWAVIGNTSNADVRPVVMFVRGGTYKPRLQLRALANDQNARDRLARSIRHRIYKAAGL